MKQVDIRNNSPLYKYARTWLDHNVRHGDADAMELNKIMQHHDLSDEQEIAIRYLFDYALGKEAANDLGYHVVASTRSPLTAAVARHVELADWWSALSPELQEEYIKDHPDSDKAKNAKRAHDTGTGPDAKPKADKRFKLRGAFKKLIDRVPDRDKEFFTTGGPNPGSKQRTAVANLVKNKSYGIVNHLKKQKDEWHDGMKAIHKIAKGRELGEDGEKAIKDLSTNIVHTVGTVAHTNGLGHALVGALHHNAFNMVKDSALKAVAHSALYANLITAASPREENELLMRKIIEEISEYIENGNIPDDAWESSIRDSAELHGDPGDNPELEDGEEPDEDQEQDQDSDLEDDEESDLVDDQDQEDDAAAEDDSDDLEDEDFEHASVSPVLSSVISRLKK